MWKSEASAAVSIKFTWLIFCVWGGCIQMCDHMAIEALSGLAELSTANQRIHLNLGTLGAC